MNLHQTVLFYILVSYSIGFALIAFLPGLGSLLPFGLGAALYLAWLPIQISHDGSIGSALAEPFVVVAEVGVTVGFVARASIIAGHNRFPKLASAQFLIPASYLLGAAIAWSVIDM